jgi:alkylated DNA repair dioxygenase AlkB
VGEYPQAKKYFHYRKTKQGATARYLYGVFSGEQGEELTLALDLKEGSVVFMEGRDSKAFLQQLH